MKYTKISHTVHGSTLAAPALGPVGLQLRRLISILERLVEVLERSIRARAVGVQDMVIRFESNCFAELLTVS